MLEDWQQSSHVYPTQYSRAQARPGQTQRDSRSRNRPGLNQPKTWYRLVTLKLIFTNLQSNNSSLDGFIAIFSRADFYHNHYIFILSNVLRFYL